MDVRSLKEQRDRLVAMIDAAGLLAHKYAGTSLEGTYLLWMRSAEDDLAAVEHEYQVALSMMTSGELEQLRGELHP